MPDNGCGQKAAAAAEPAGPQVEVDILEIGEEVLVEQTYPGKEIPAIEGGAGTGPEDLAIAVVGRPVRLHGAEAIPCPSAEKPVSGPIEKCALLKIEHLQGEKIIVAIGLHPGLQGGKTTGVNLHVVIEQENPGGGRLLDSGVDGHTEATVVGKGDYLYLRIVTGKQSD